MPKYRKKPVVIEAIEWTGDMKPINEFCEDAATFANDCLYIHTLEGDHMASTGDFIIKGVAGEFYPCKPDIFALTYDLVTSQ